MLCSPGIDILRTDPEEKLVLSFKDQQCGSPWHMLWLVVHAVTTLI